MARDDPQTGDEPADPAADRRPPGDTNRPLPARIRSRLDGWAATRPALGAALLALGSAVLAWRVFTLLSIVPAGRVTPAGIAGMGAPLAGVVVALLALGRPARSTGAGLAGIGLAVYATSGLFVSPLPVGHPELIVTGLAVAGLGGLLCAAWRPDRARIRRGPVVRAGRSLLVGGLVLVLAFNAAPAVAGDTFPAQMETQGGFVVAQSELSAGQFDYQANCPAPAFGIGGEGCVNVTVDSTNRARIDQSARAQLDSSNAADVYISEFLIYENFYFEREDENLYFEMSADEAVAATEAGPFGKSGADERAIDAYFSEFRSERLVARLDLIDFPGTPEGIPADNIVRWTCTPHNESGFGSINDIRLGLDVSARATGGQSVSLLAHQLGSSETVLTDFELTVGTGKRDPLPATREPKTAPESCNA